MPDPPKVLPVATKVVSRPLPTEREILELAEMASFVFARPETEVLKSRLSDDAEAYRSSLFLKALEGRERQQFRGIVDLTKTRPHGIAYLLQLVLLCPQLLSGPAGLEWVIRDLTDILVQRRLDPSLDGDFWSAIGLARKALRTGRPRDKARDFFRYGFITDLMQTPEQVQNLVKKLNKTQSVEQLALAEQTLFGRSPDTRAIWRSYKRADEDLRRITKRVVAESSPTPPPTGAPDHPGGEEVAGTKKRAAGSPCRRKSTRH